MLFRPSWLLTPVRLHSCAKLSKVTETHRLYNRSYQGIPAAETVRVPTLTILNERFSNAVEILLDGSTLLKDKTFVYSSRPEHGDYQCNIAMYLAKKLGKKPHEVAGMIINKLHVSDIVSDIAISGPGFINMKLSSSYWERRLRLVIDSGHGPNLRPKQRVVVDYSSPNIAKEMHVGHLRSTIIGDSICRLLQFQGHEVSRVNHVGDWGTQFGMLIAYMKEFKDCDVDDRNIESGERLKKLVNDYQMAKRKFDESETFRDAARQEVVQLQKGSNKVSVDLWESICEISRLEFQKIYQRLGIHGLEEKGESFYRNFIPEMLMILESQNLLEKSQGATCMFMDGYKNKDGSPRPLILEKSDGAHLYSTTDMAALYYRVFYERADRIIYVTDSGQSGHFQMLFEAARIAGFLSKDNNSESVTLQHVPFGVVLGSNGKKFQTRSGEAVKLRELLDKACMKAKDGILERFKAFKGGDKEHLGDESISVPPNLEEAANVIGISSIKYADLSMNRENDYKFSYSKMLSMNGNTAPYMLYAYARLQGLKRKLNKEFPKKAVVGQEGFYFRQDVEVNLAKHIVRFPDILSAFEKDLYPNILCDYLYELCQKFNQFYENCPVIDSEENVRLSRTGLCCATEHTLNVGLHLLGIETIEEL